MTLYPFEMQLAADADNAEVVVRGGAITFYDPSDTDRTSPLELLDASGLPLDNPMLSSPAGFTRAFQAEIPHVMWHDGTYTGYLSSYKGLLNEAIAAREAAEAAVINGIPDGGEVGQVLIKSAGADYAAAWRSLIVVIGPTDEWPTGLPDGTVVVRSEV